MAISNACRIALFALLTVATAIADDTTTSAYQKGTIKQDFSAAHKFYEIQGGEGGYQINNCGDFQSGQVVDYRVKESKVYIRTQDGKEYKCSVEATIQRTAPAAPTPPHYEKGTIGGYEVRRDTHIGGGGGGGGGTPGNPVSTWTRHAKVYELHGVDLIYKVDYCGAFQAGQFSPGQVVEYRVEGNRVFILHDSDKEYSCQLEGTRQQENVKAEESAKADPASSAAPAAPASATIAKVFVASVPDGADIEVDGNFAGNTPSDLAVPEGDHAITVKKSGYKDWERKMKVVAGSSIHLNADMEKAVQ